MAAKGKTKRATTKLRAVPAEVSPNNRQDMIENAAYFRAEQDGFQASADQYWLEAEAEVDQAAQL